MKVTITLEDLPSGAVEIQTGFDPRLNDQTPTTKASTLLLISQQAIRQFYAGSISLKRARH